MKTTKTETTVTFEFDLESGKRQAQKFLYAQWLHYLTYDCGHLSNSWKEEEWDRSFKKQFIKPLLLKDNKEYYQKYFDDAREILVRSKLDYPDAYWLVEDAALSLVQTGWLSVMSMSEYLNQIKNYCDESLFVELPVPDDLAWCINLKK